MNVESFKTPHGELLLAVNDGALVLCDWKYRKMRAAIDKRIREGLETATSNANSKRNDKALNEMVIRTTKHQLNEYFEGERTEFDLPVKTIGTDFQKLVWTELQKIPYGKTTSYLKLSRQLGNAEAIRAVATANGANALSIIIPCHRVVGSKGELTGYAGGLTAKKKLLELENPQRTAQLDLF